MKSSRACSASLVGSVQVVNYSKYQASLPGTTCTSASALSSRARRRAIPRFRELPYAPTSFHNARANARTHTAHENKTKQNKTLRHARSVQIRRSRRPRARARVRRLVQVRPPSGVERSLAVRRLLRNSSPSSRLECIRYEDSIKRVLHHLCRRWASFYASSRAAFLVFDVE